MSKGALEFVEMISGIISGTQEDILRCARDVAMDMWKGLGDEKYYIIAKEIEEYIGLNY